MGKSSTEEYLDKQSIDFAIAVALIAVLMWKEDNPNRKANEIEDYKEIYLNKALDKIKSDCQIFGVTELTYAKVAIKAIRENKDWCRVLPKEKGN